MDAASPSPDACHAALADARSRYVARTPASRAAHARAAAFMPGGNTRSVLFYEPYPLAMERGEGCQLWDADGHGYLDLLGEYTAGLYGHSDPAIRAAIMAALDRGLSLGAPNLYEAELAGLICARIPSMERLRFTNSGTEANLMALAAATAFTGRHQVLVFRGGYHGGVLTFGRGHSPANVPHDFMLARYNDPDVAALVHRHRFAAILVEPMLGAGGCIPADPGFLAALRTAADSTGALLILDEVMTSRCGPGGRQGMLGLRPDLTTLGKYYGGGLSFGAFGGRADIMALLDPTRPDALPHAGTFNNNVLSMAAGIAGLTHRFTPDAAAALWDRGEALRERLNALCREAGVAMQFTGLGSLMNVHFRAGAIACPADATGDDRLRDLFFFDMAEAGVYLARRGFIALSLPVGAAEVERTVQAVRRFVEERRGVVGRAG